MNSLPSSLRTAGDLPVLPGGAAQNVDDIGLKSQPSAQNSMRQHLQPMSPEQSVQLPEQGHSTFTAFEGELITKNAMETLADELAGAWNEDDRVDAYDSLEAQLSQALDEDSDPMLNSNDGYTNRLDVYSPIYSGFAPELSWSPSKRSMRPELRRLISQQNESTLCGDDDLEKDKGFTPSFEARVSAIEDLAEKGIRAYGREADDIVKRVASSLKDLPSQTEVEDGTSRLITSQTAFTSHLANQTRTILTLVHSVLSPLSAPPETDLVDEIITLLTDLLLHIPMPPAQCLHSLHTLALSTSDLQSTLTYLSDTVYMTRQTSTQASRKLKTVNDLIVEIRQDAEAHEKGVQWIKTGRWDEKLATRECAQVCGEVVEEFEQVCNGWRKRLAAGTIQMGAA